MTVTVSNESLTQTGQHSNTHLHCMVLDRFEQHLDLARQDQVFVVKLDVCNAHQCLHKLAEENGALGIVVAFADGSLLSEAKHAHNQLSVW